jgi:hypothetical protein
MTVFKIARFAVRPDARVDVEQAMREFALYVGLELEDSSWTTYRDRKNPNVYVTLVTADDEHAPSTSAPPADRSSSPGCSSRGSSPTSRPGSTSSSPPAAAGFP